MRENKFKKFLRQDSQVSLDEKIKKFNNKMDGVDTLSEKMTTGSVYPETETQPYIAPTSEPAPLGDFSDLNTFTWDTASQGDGSTISHDFSQLTTTDVNGQTQSIFELPSVTTTDGSGYIGTPYGLAFGVNVAVTGTPLGYFNENGFVFVYQINNVFSVTHTDFSRAIVDYYNNNTFVQKGVYIWTSLRYRGGQLVTPTQINGDKGLYRHNLLIPVDGNGNVKTNNIVTDLGQPRTTVLNRMGDPDSEYSYPGYIDIGTMLGVSPRGLDYLDQKSFAELYNTKSGRELAKLADAGLISIPAAVAVGKLLLAGGMAAVTAYGQQQGWGQDIVNAVVNAVSSDPYGRDQAGPTTTGSNPGARTLTPQQQAEVEAAGNELRDAQRALNDAEESGNQTQIDMAKERVDRASKRRRSLRKKHTEENKNRKESSDLKGEVLTEGWQSPEHTTVEKDPKKRWLSPNAGTDSKKWFDPQQIAPEYPVNPPEMIDGYNSKSNLAPKEVSKDDYLIKITKKDLVRNHKLKGSEIAHLMETINRINKYLASHPEELIHAQKRYPKHDARLAQLNWEMDTMLSASKNYLDSQFPENKRLYDKLTKETEKSIKLTDPDTYKKPDSKLVGVNKLMRVQNVMDSYGPLINLRLEKKLELEKNILENKKKEKELKTQKQNEELAKILHNDWRSELQEESISLEIDDNNLAEAMTSSGLFSVTLEPSDDIIMTPDVSTATDLEGATLYDGAIYLSHIGATNTRTATINNVDLTQVDYMVFRRTYIPSGAEYEIPWGQISQINGQYVGWGVIPISQIPGGPLNDDSFFYTYLTPDQQIKNASLKFYQSIASYAAGDPTYGGWYISQISFYRTRPMNVFVPLDSPEATAFIRTDPIMQGLSPNQRYKKLLEMLDAGDEYLLKALGMQGSKARPAEVQMPQSWQQAASQPSYMNIQVGDQQYVSQDGQVQTDTTRGIKDGEMDGRPIYYDDQGNMRVSQPQPEYNPTVYNPEIDGGYTHLDYLYGGPEERARIQNIWNQRNKNASTSTTTSTAPPAQNYQKPTPMFDKYGRRTDTGELERGMRTTDPVGDLATLGAAAAITKGGLALAKTGAVGQTIRQVGKVFKPKPTGPVKAKYPTSVKPKPKPSSQYRIDEPLNPTGTSRPPSYSRGRGMGDRWEGPLRNSYEPSGELISEKKRLKSPKEVIANKIPGYYDGKPSPLGFPMEPPAKMVNGMHPDLVDGKKVSNRFNRLDPESAKAMPPTGNPHIDKKVRAAAKKPK